VSYKQNYKEYGLPAHPERIYDEWVSYKDFLISLILFHIQNYKSLVIAKTLKMLKNTKVLF
jgi:hypothetical protein